MSLAIGLQPLGCSPDPERDTDGDGLSDRQELNVTGTSPLLADTDGDGLSDYQEVVTLAFNPANDPYHFNPLIADLPQLAVVFAGPPILTIDTEESVTGTDTADNSLTNATTVGTSATQSQTMARSDTLAVSKTLTNSTSLTEPIASMQSTTAGGGADAGADARADAGGADAGADARADAASDGAPDAPGEAAAASAIPASLTLTNAVSTTVSPSTTFSTSLTLDNTQSQEDTASLTRSAGVSQSNTLTAVAGVLSIPAVLENRSPVAFNVTNLVLGATLVDPSGALIAIDNLGLNDESLVFVFTPFALAPWERSTPVVFASGRFSLEKARAILFSGDPLMIQVGVYGIVDQGGKPFAFDVQDVLQKTALLAIDYGGRRSPELYQVATNANPDHPGTTVSKLMNDTLRIPYQAEVQSGLTSVREVGTIASGRTRWSINLLHNEGPASLETDYGMNSDPYDFDNIEVQAGDVVRVAFTGPGDPAWDGGTAPPPLATGSTDGGLEVGTFDAAATVPLPTPPPRDAALSSPNPQP